MQRLHGVSRIAAPLAGLPVVFTIFQTGNKANGGVESITHIIERLERFRPVIVTQLETPINERWRQAGAEVHVWPLPYRVGDALAGSSLRSKARRVRSLIETNLRLYRLLRRTGARVVHCNDPLAVLHAAPGARAARARAIFNIRDTLYDDDRHGWRKWRMAARLTHRQVVLSREMHDAVTRNLGKAANGTVLAIYSIVDFTRMRPPSAEERTAERTRLGIAPGEIAFAYVATFNEKKAQLAFIRNAGPELLRLGGKLRVHFVGDFEPERNPYARACADAAVELGLGGIVAFPGYTPQVEAWYRAADAIVLASRTEGLARCMIEGIACGTPVASFDVCSAREVLEEQACGLVVPQGDYVALARAMGILSDDPELRRAMGEAGAQAARQLFEERAVVRKYEDLYEALADRAAAAV